MTVALGLVCSDGVVVAADSMASSGNTARNATKVYAMANAPAVWTAAGSVYVIEDVAAMVHGLDNREVVAETANPHKRALLEGEELGLRNKVGGGIRNAMKKCYESALPLGERTIAGTQHVFSSSFLFAGYTPAGPYLLEVAGDGQMNWHTDARMYAVGSGGEFATVAMALMQHYLEGDDITVELGAQVAYRAIETTCEVSAGGVGLPVRIAVADIDGGRLFDQDELNEVQTLVAGWKQLERDTLRSGANTEPAEELPSLDEDA